MAMSVLTGQKIQANEANHLYRICCQKINWDKIIGWHRISLIAEYINDGKLRFVKGRYVCFLDMDIYCESTKRWWVWDSIEDKELFGSEKVKMLTLAFGEKALSDE